MFDHEVFGPVLHMLRFCPQRPAGAARSMINATGYGLTFGIHTRIDETIAAATRAVHAGNIYVNRNIDRRGGRRAALRRQRAVRHRSQGRRPALSAAPVAAGAGGRRRPARRPPCPRRWRRMPRLAEGRRARPRSRRLRSTSMRAAPIRWRPANSPDRSASATNIAPARAAVHPHRGRDRDGASHLALAAVLATGNRSSPAVGDKPVVAGLPAASARGSTGMATRSVAAVLFEGGGDALIRLRTALAGQNGPIVPVHAVVARRPSQPAARLPARNARRGGLGQHEHGGGRRQCQPDD